jgi:RNA polymerase-binding transcription factor DksA
MRRNRTKPRAKPTGAMRVVAERRAIEARLAALNGGSPFRERGRFGADNTPSVECAEIANEIVAKELEFASRGVLARRLKELGRAQERIRQGTYGVCEGCGRPIPRRRLEVLPEATLCVPCAEQNEQRARPAPAAGRVYGSLRR